MLTDSDTVRSRMTMVPPSALPLATSPAPTETACALIARAPAPSATADAPAERPLSACVVSDVMAVGLSTLRSELLPFAATGGSRAQVPQTFGIGNEALKKHLAKIYRATGAWDWDELTRIFVHG